MKSFLSICLAIFATAAFAGAADTPNIIVILADDQGFGDVSVLNPESKIATPNIDRIASEGMIFGDAHTSSSVCTPTRYSLLTGRYHWRTHLQKGVLGGFSPPLIDADRLTVAGVLQQKGYHTACIGKWHLGMNWPLKEGGTANDRGDFSGGFKGGWDVDYKAPIQNGPVSVGFDYFYGISASLDMPPYVYILNDTPTQPATVEKAFHRKGPAAADFEAVDVLPEIAEKSVAYIADRAGNHAEQPFFMYIPLNAPHTPIVPTDEFKGKSGINIYADFTLQVDHHVGQILQALDDNGVADDTLIIFTTDNGCSPQAKFDELAAAGHNPGYIYRGHKADIFEGGHRVPFVVRWPGKVTPGSRYDHLIGQVDILATAAQIAGAEVPDSAGEDSVSLLPVLLGETQAPIRSTLIQQSIGGYFAIRDGNWKLNVCPGSGGWSAPRPGSKEARELPAMQLYDLAADPGETNNLAESNSERVEAMKALLANDIQRGRTTPGPDLQNDVEVVMVKPQPEPRKKQPAKKK